MSLDIYVTNSKTGESRDMNWRRNPYGLCNWSEANYNFRTESKPDDESEQRLWHVINNWNYDESDQVDRRLFLEVVQRYGRVLINDLQQGYFFFSERALEQFVMPHLSIVPDMPIGVAPGVTITNPDKSKEYGLPMEYFGHPCFGLSDRHRPHAHTLEYYKQWFGELIAFAEMLQDPDAVFYCSN